MKEVSESYIITANEIYSRYLRQADAAIATKECVSSCAQYVRAFCLALSTVCKRSNTNYCSMINYITLSALPEMTEAEYISATDATKLEKYEQYLFSDHLISSALWQFDIKNKTAFYSLFIDMLGKIAEIFVQTDDNNLLAVDKFVSEFRKKALNIRFENPTSMNDTKTTTQQEQARTENTRHSQVSNANSKITPQKSPTANVPTCRKNSEIDFQYFVRIVLPTLVSLGICIWAVSTKTYLFVFVALFPLLITASGVKKSKSRCPQCRAWQSVYIVSKNRLRQDKVKVRRPVGSVYFRSKGRTTYGIRQQFVSAEENTYDAIFRCNSCGYQYSGVYTEVDDKIRG